MNFKRFHSLLNFVEFWDFFMSKIMFFKIPSQTRKFCRTFLKILKDFFKLGKTLNELILMNNNSTRCLPTTVTLGRCRPSFASYRGRRISLTRPIMTPRRRQSETNLAGWRFSTRSRTVLQIIVFRNLKNGLLTDPNSKELQWRMIESGENNLNERGIYLHWWIFFFFSLWFHLCYLDPL